MAERSDGQRTTRTFSITLGGQVYPMRVKSILGAVEYRKVLGQLVRVILSALNESGVLDRVLAELGRSVEAPKRSDRGPRAVLVAPGSGSEAVSEGQGGLVERMLDAGLAKVLPEAIPLVLTDGLTLLVESLRAYAPELNEAIDGASDEEVVTAAREVLAVNFPLLRSILTTTFRTVVVASQED